MSSSSTTRQAQILLLSHLLSQTSALTTVNLWQAIPSAPQVASIIGVSGTATTYILGCADNFPAQVSGVKKDELCIPLAALTVTQGPSTLAYANSVNMASVETEAPTMVKENVNCALTATTAAVCVIKHDGVDSVVVPKEMDAEIASSLNALKSSLKTPQTSTLLGTDYPVFGPVVVTAGAEKLSGGVKQVSTADSTGEAGASARPSRQPSSSTSLVVEGTSLETNPAGGGVNTSARKTTSSAAYITPTGAAGASHSSTSSTSAKPTTSAKAAASSTSAISATSILLGLAAVVLYLL